MADKGFVVYGSLSLAEKNELLKDYGGEIKATPRLKAAIGNRERLVAEIKALTALKEEVEAKLKDAIGYATKIVDKNGNVLLAYDATAATTFDGTKFRKETDSDIWKNYMVTKLRRTFH